MKQPEDGGPAFPVPGREYNITPTGMSLRDYFAGQAMQAYIQALAMGGHTISQSHREIADESYRISDHMLEQRAMDNEIKPEADVPDDWVTCVYCSGSGTDGFDRCHPPSPYVCASCDGKGKVPPSTIETP